MLIYIRTGVRSLSEQSQLQPHFHSKARQLSTQLLNVLFVNLTVVLLGYLSTSIERPLQDSNPSRPLRCSCSPEFQSRYFLSSTLSCEDPIELLF